MWNASWLLKAELYCHSCCSGETSRTVVVEAVELLLSGCYGGEDTNRMVPLVLEL